MPAELELVRAGETDRAAAQLAASALASALAEDDEPLDDRYLQRRRLAGFKRWALPTAAFAGHLVQLGDEEAGRLRAAVAELLEAAEAKLDRGDGDVDEAAGLIDEARPRMDELIGYCSDRQRELYPAEAPELEREDDERVERLTATAPPELAERIRAHRRELDAHRARFASRRATASPVPRVGAVADVVPLRATRPVSRRRERAAGRGRPRPAAADDDGEPDPPDLARPLGQAPRRGGPGA
jgi:hypothetical protein